MNVAQAEALRLAGANARAAGSSKLDCPFYRFEACPAATGEPLAEWTAKIDQWMLGWKIEDAIRPAPTDGLLTALGR